MLSNLDAAHDIRTDLATIPMLPSCTSSLVDALESLPAETEKSPSNAVIALLERLQSANPNDTTISDEDNTLTFGHLQHTGGSESLAIEKVLSDWDALGSAQTALLLLSAAIRVQKIAVHAIFFRGVKPTSRLLAEIYLEKLINRIWTLWEDERRKVSPVTPSHDPRSNTPYLGSSTCHLVLAQQPCGYDDSTKAIQCMSLCSCDTYLIALHSPSRKRSLWLGRESVPLAW